MARKRMIDPSIWADEDFGMLSPEAQVFYIGLISNADDEGILPGNPNYLASIIMPYKAITQERASKILYEVLSHMRSVIYYEQDGKRYISLANWDKYQTINKKAKTKYPKPTDERVKVILPEDYHTIIVGLPEDYRNNAVVVKEDYGNSTVVVKEGYGNTIVGLPPNRIEKNRIEKNRNKYIGTDEPSPVDETEKKSSAKKKSVAKKKNTELYNHIKKRFEDGYGPFGTPDDYKKQGKHIWDLVARAEQMFPEEPKIFIDQVIEQFKELKNGDTTFWQEQPFLPSILNSGNIWPRVIERLRASPLSQEAAMAKVKDFFADGFTLRGMRRVVDGH